MKVFVDTMFGSTFTVSIDPRNIVFDIKRIIENSQGIPASMQTLYFNDAELAVDHYQLKVYCIVNNSRLLLWLRDNQFNNQILHQSPYAIQGFVPSMGGSNFNQVVPSHASESNFFNQYGLVSNDGLFPEMHQDISLKQGFCPGTTFEENVKIQESFRRNKKNQDLLQREPSFPSNTFDGLSLGELFTNENHMFQTDQSSTFGDISFGDYRHILTDNIQSNWPSGTFDEIIIQVFQTEHSLVQANSTEGSSSQVFQIEKSPPPQKLMIIMTQYNKPGSKFMLEVKATDNVEALKKELEYMLDLPAKGYFLLHKERVLDDDKSFSMNRVATGDTIEIFPGPVIEDCYT